MITRKQAVHFLRELGRTLRVAQELANRDFENQFRGAALGVLWVFIQPMLYTVVLFVIFKYGFRSEPELDMPFSLYLLIGVTCWLYFVDNITVTTKTISAHAYLVRKTHFRLSVLPVVRVLSSLPAHITLVVLVVLFALSYGIYPDIFGLLQFAYYFFCFGALLVSLGWITAPLNVFLPDVGRIVAIVCQIGFWVTPIFWSTKLIPERFHAVIDWNPMYYIIHGYRDLIVTKSVFWASPESALRFWMTIGLLAIIGRYVFRRLRPHFAEVV